MEVRIEKNFIGKSGMPLTLFCMNNNDPEEFAKGFFRTGFFRPGYEDSDNFMIEDNGRYRGVNFVWQVMKNATPEDVRKYSKNTLFYGNTVNFRDDKRDTWNWDSPWIKPIITDTVRRDIVDLLEKGIELEINGRRGRIGVNEGIYHFVGMKWFKIAYVKCYNEDNGIKEGCFVTTAVCDSFGKPDDCYELTAFRKFRDGWLTAQSDGKSLIEEYYAVAPQIVANINRLPDPSQVYKTIWQKYLEPCLDFLRNDDNLSCKNKYSEMMRELKKQFL